MRPAGVACKERRVVFVSFRKVVDALIPFL